MEFVKSTMPKGEYKDEERVGDVVFTRFGATENGGNMEFYEACVASEGYDRSKTEEEYNSYIAKAKASELQSAITIKEKEIMEYDSEEGIGKVNNFYFEYGGKKFSYWFNAYERTALTSEATQWAKKYGTYRIDARKYGVSFEISCETLLDWLGQLKDYAIKCYNKTTDHLLAVGALTTVEEVAAYDYKVGYPENLVFKVDGETAGTVNGATQNGTETKGEQA